jgi:hypothetical protein
MPDAATNTVAGMLAYTEGLLVTLRSNATAEICRYAAKSALTTNDLFQLRNALSELHDSLARADLGDQLSNAETRVQTALAMAANRSADPEDQTAFLDRIDLKDFRSSIETQKARAAFLERDLDRVTRSITASLQVAAPLQDVLSQDDLSSRLATRLRVMLAEWQKSTPKSGSSQGTIELPAWAGAVASATIITKTNEAVARVIRMAQARVGEQVILEFIKSVDAAFDLKTADQILQVRQKGLSDKIITAMLEHDGVLRSRTARGP